MERIIVHILIFLLNPLVGIFLLAFQLWNENETDRTSSLTLGIFISIFLGVQNTGKEMVGDYFEYYKYFQLVPKISSITDFVLKFKKEPIFYAYTYCGYYIFLGKWSFYIFSLTFLNYFVLSLAVVRLSVLLCSNNKNTVVALFFLLFFFQEFAAMGNLVRQCLAESLLVLFLYFFYFENKTKYWLAVCALGVHSSVLPILGIGLLPIIKDKLSLKRLLNLLLCILLLVLVFYQFSSSLSGVPFLGYIVQRTDSTMFIHTDSWQTTVGLNTSTWGLILMVILMIVYLYAQNKVLEKENMFEITSSFNPYPYINMMIVLVFFIIICDIVGAYFFLMRYFFFIYAFQVLLVFLFMHYWNSKIKYIISFCGLLVLFLYFLSYYSNGQYLYYPLWKMLFMPIPFY